MAESGPVAGVIAAGAVAAPYRYASVLLFDMGGTAANPRDFVLVAFGGAGPRHANALARELGIATVLVPPSPGVA